MENYDYGGGWWLNFSFELLKRIKKKFLQIVYKENLVHFIEKLKINILFLYWRKNLLPKSINYMFDFVGWYRINI